MTTPADQHRDGRDDGFQAALALAKAGDPSGWSELYRRHHGALLGFLRSQMRGDAEDVASEAWISATRTIHAFEGDDRSFRSWLVTIGRRRMIDRLRAAGRQGTHTPLEHVEAQLGDPGRDPAQVAADRDMFARVCAALDDLTDEEAQVVRLRVVAGVDTARVAEMMGRTPNSVRVLQHRALKKLAAMSRAGNTGAQGPMDQAG